MPRRFRRCAKCLAKLASDPANGIDRILEAEELHKRGGYPPASFFVGLKPGWKTGSTMDGPVLSKLKVGWNARSIAGLAGSARFVLPDWPGRSCWAIAGL